MAHWPWSMAILVFCGASMGTVGMVFLGRRRPRLVLTSGGLVLADWLVGFLLGWAFVVPMPGGWFSGKELWVLFGFWVLFRLMVFRRVVWRPLVERQRAQAVGGAQTCRTAGGYQEVGVVVPPGEEALVGVERIEGNCIEGAEEQEGYAQARRRRRLYRIRPHGCRRSGKAVPGRRKGIRKCTAR